MGKYYRYKVSGNFCVLEIHLCKENPSQYVLFGDGEAFHSYDSLQDAIYAVSVRKTGYKVWDQLKQGPTNPNSLVEWEELED